MLNFPVGLRATECLRMWADESRASEMLSVASAVTCQHHVSVLCSEVHIKSSAFKLIPVLVLSAYPSLGHTDGQFCPSTTRCWTTVTPL